MQSFKMYHLCGAIVLPTRSFVLPFSLCSYHQSLLKILDICSGGIQSQIACTL